MSLVIIAAIFWFSSFNVIMTSDKLIHVFGKLLPVIGLVISMVFRFIPLLQQRLSEIQAGQAALGKERIKGPIRKIRQYTKEISTLVSWSLEASIESADSMSARGYGLRGRTSYSIFKIERSDVVTLAITIACGIAVLVGYHFKIAKLSFYPFIVRAKEVSFWLEAAVYLAFLVLLLLPVVIDLYGELKWKNSLSKI
jgi:energy-coupling factor transport system permease protein